MRLRYFGLAGLLQSIAGRTIAILAFGITLAAGASMLIAEQSRLRDLEQNRRIGLVEAVAGVVAGLRSRPVETDRRLASGEFGGVRLALRAWPGGEDDPEAMRLLESRIGVSAAPEVIRVHAPFCSNGRVDPGEADRATRLDCWYVRFLLPPGNRRILVADIPLIRVYRSDFLDPLYLVLLAGIATAIAVLVTRFTIAPLSRLTRAARQFSVSVDPTDVAEGGPREVRDALATFNMMQQRVRDGVRERTHILAAISHDLQTPLTRMRLRLEQVENEGLRARLVGDLTAMQRLVAEGLDLAQSTESREPWSLVDVDSLLSSLADDMTDLGADVRYVTGSGTRARVRLAALTRALQNLIDNAVQYAGGAELQCAEVDGVIKVSVRDDGPGIPDADIHTAFEPFVRLVSNSTDQRTGSGLGLTIARAQAMTFGASVGLANRIPRGLEATIVISPL